MTAENVPEWESELWSYMSKGDGENCPLIGSCSLNYCSHNVQNYITNIDLFMDYDEPFWGYSDPYGFECPKRTEVGRIFELVEKLVNKYLVIGKIDSMPVPAEIINLFDREYPIEIREVPLRAYHGAIWRLKDRWIIQINKNDTPARKRFSLFHEAFHIMAHCKATPVFRKAGIEGGSFNELLADHFAGCILMPSQRVKEKWTEFNDIDKMAEIFELPKSVVWIGLKQMGLLE